MIDTTKNSNYSRNTGSEENVWQKNISDFTSVSAYILFLSFSIFHGIVLAILRSKQSPVYCPKGKQKTLR